jgi:hypothetical protein
MHSRITRASRSKRTVATRVSKGAIVRLNLTIGNSLVARPAYLLPHKGSSAFLYAAGIAHSVSVKLTIGNLFLNSLKSSALRAFFGVNVIGFATATLLQAFLGQVVTIFTCPLVFKAVIRVIVVVVVTHCYLLEAASRHKAVAIKAGV